MRSPNQIATAFTVTAAGAAGVVAPVPAESFNVSDQSAHERTIDYGAHAFAINGVGRMTVKAEALRAFMAPALGSSPVTRLASMPKIPEGPVTKNGAERLYESCPVHAGVYPGKSTRKKGTSSWGPNWSKRILHVTAEEQPDGRYYYRAKILPKFRKSYRHCGAIFERFDDKGFYRKATLIKDPYVRDQENPQSIRNAIFFIQKIKEFKAKN